MRVMKTVVLMVILYYITTNATADIPNILSLQWPSSVCEASGFLCNRDLVRSTHGFTIHGLWPNLNPLEPGDPCQAESFNDFYSQIKNGGDRRLVRLLELFWPSLTNVKTNEEFWQHEWEVHGACTEPLMSLKEYFQKTIQLFQSLSEETTLDILQKAAIIPGSIHSARALVDKMKEMHRKPAIACLEVESPAGTYYVIAEVRFCVNEAGTEIIDCLSAVLDASCPFIDGVSLVFPAALSSIDGFNATIHE